MSWRKSSHSTFNGNCVEVVSWRKPARSTGNGQCVEVGQGQQVIAVRDSKDPGGPVLVCNPRAWRALLHGLTG